MPLISEGRVYTLRFYSFFVILISLLFGVPIAIQGQPLGKAKQGNGKKAFSVRTQDNPFTYKNYEFNFPNLNKVLFYNNPTLLKKIAAAEGKQDRKRLQELLEEYVSNFGVQNFYKSTEYLAKLAQVYELNGDKNRAKSLYRYVIKHSRSRRDSTIKSYYDSSVALSRENYVPLRYYYELVEYRRAIDTLFPPANVFSRMDEGVNSPYADYAPALNKSDDTLILTSKRNFRKGTKIPNEDLFFTRREDGYFLESFPLSSINTEYNEGSAIVSKDGLTIYFCRCESPDSYGSCDIFSAKYNPETEKYENIKNLGPNVNGSNWDSHPSLSHTEDTLFFASDRLGGFGGSDIYFSVKQKNGEWGPAQNIGPSINTKFSEVSPFMHHDFPVLYFSSNGQLLNFGRFDIYKSYKVDGLWQEPKNIGPLVNGKGDEYYFTIDSQSKDLYYSRSDSARPNDLNLFSFPLPMEAQPTATTKFEGTLTDSSGKPFSGVVSIIDLDRGIEVAPRALREDGSFDFDLIGNSNYLLVINGEEFFRIQEAFYLRGDTVVNKKAKNIKNIKVSFSSIEFQEGSTEILPSMFNDLNQVVNFMVDNPRFKLRISGHTDGKGNKGDNMALSLARSESIKKYLMEEGKISGRKIEAMGFGSTKPIIVPEKTEADRKINRRVEFEIIPPERP